MALCDEKGSCVLSTPLRISTKQNSSSAQLLSHCFGSWEQTDYEYNKFPFLNTVSYAQICKIVFRF